MPLPDPSTPPRRRRWLAPALFASLAVNLLVAGVLLGLVLPASDDPAGDRPRARVDMGGTAWLAALAPEDREALRAAWAARGSDLRGLRAERQAELAALAEVLRAADFDPEAATEALAREAERRAERQAVLHGLLVAHLSEMPAAERAAVADRLEAAAARPGRGLGLRRGARPPE